MTALRVVQRMKRDSIHSGRRPSGLCGAALLMAARLHDFNRSPSDIIKIVKVHESTLRKRLIEFGDTPSSALTLDEFMTIDLEEEQDPPAFKAARKKDRERLQRLENIDIEINDLQAEIDKQLEEHKLGKARKRKDASSIEREDAERFIRESNLSVIQHYVEDDADNPTAETHDPLLNESNNSLMTGLGPDITTMGLTPVSDREIETKENTSATFETDNGEIDIADLDDEELDGYIMSDKEAQFKHTLWNKVNADYLVRQKEKEEKRLKEKEEGKPEKKRRRTTTKRNKNQTPANTAGEAIEKMLQEKKISTKINYEVLKSLNVTITATSKEQHKNQDASVTPMVDANPTGTVHKSAVNPLKMEDIPVITKRQRSTKPTNVQITKEKSQVQVEIEMNTNQVLESGIDSNTIAYETDDYIDEEVETDPTEMTVGQMLGHHGSEDGNDYGYEYDEEDY
ncbi:hypothetical protein KM043_017570 [Ampulex compressa]|nr:hypothetical protein KM043_017570 [Ampulex compressa]